MRHAHAAAAAAWLALGSPLVAQPRLAPGTRIRALVSDTIIGDTLARDTLPRRAEAADGGWRIGTVVSTTPSTLTLEAQRAALVGRT